MRQPELRRSRDPFAQRALGALGLAELEARPPDVRALRAGAPHVAGLLEPGRGLLHVRERRLSAPRSAASVPRARCTHAAPAGSPSAAASPCASTQASSPEASSREPAKRSGIDARAAASATRSGAAGAAGEIEQLARGRVEALAIAELAARDRRLARGDTEARIVLLQELHRGERGALLARGLALEAVRLRRDEVELAARPRVAAGDPAIDGGQRGVEVAPFERLLRGAQVIRRRARALPAELEVPRERRGVALAGLSSHSAASLCPTAMSASVSIA